MSFLNSLRKGGTIIIIILIILAIVFFRQLYFIVEPGERGLIKTLGSLNQTVHSPGLNFKLPFVQTAITINVQTQKIEKTAVSASKDLQVVEASVALNYAFIPNEIRDLYQNFGSEIIIEDRIIVPAIQESVKASTAQFRAEELITQRQAVSNMIKENLEDKLEKNGVNVIEVNIVNFNFTDEFDAAIEAKVKAEQEALTEKNRLETIKYQAQQRIEQARGIADAELIQAEAKAEAIRIQSEAIKAQGGQAYVQLQRINQRDGVLPQTMMGESTPVMIDLTTNTPSN